MNLSCVDVRYRHCEPHFAGIVFIVYLCYKLIKLRLLYRVMTAQIDVIKQNESELANIVFKIIE